jgi:hypothetical protein
MSERPPKFSIPMKRIEQLINLAKKHNLGLLEVGHIRIAPMPPQAPMGVTRESQLERDLMTATRDGKPLTERQREDAILFGPSGVNYDD